jgi:hypothetical protein
MRFIKVDRPEASGIASALLAPGTRGTMTTARGLIVDLEPVRQAYPRIPRYQRDTPAGLGVQGHRHLTRAA